MITDRPTVKIIQDKSKRRKSDLCCPLFIQVTWKFKRAKESTGIYLTEKDFKKGVYKSNKLIKRRLNEIENRIDDLLSERRDFSPIEVLKVQPSMTPMKIISEMCHIKRLEPRTSDGYMTTHHVLQSYFGEDYTLSSLTLPMIQGFARTIRVSPSTMAFYLKDLKSLLGFAKEKGYIKENPMERWKFKLDGFRDREKPRSRSIAEIKQFINIWKTTGDTRIKEVLGIWLAGFVFNGLALVDLMRVKWCEIEEVLIEDSFYYTFTIDRKKTRETAHITVPVTDLSKELLSFLRTSPWVGKGDYKTYVNRYLKLVDKGLTYYQCRHSFASLLVGSRTPLNVIASMLGRSVNGLSAYIHKVNETAVLGEASKSLLVFEEDKPVSMEDELAVFEELVD